MPKRRAGSNTLCASNYFAFNSRLPRGLHRLKLYLCPAGMTSLNASLPPLPAGKTVLQLFSDFYAYLFESTKDFILRDDPSGKTVWNTVKDNIGFVLSHPNGWEGEQRNQMRQAMINAQLICDNDKGRSQINFVTEG